MLELTYTDAEQVAGKLMKTGWKSKLQVQVFQNVVQLLSLPVQSNETLQ